MRLPTLLLLLAAATPLRAAPATNPATEIPSLIQQLSDDDWKLRQKAQERLVSIGDAAIEPLRTVARDSKDEEVRTRAESALRQIAEKSRSGPTLITLHLQDAPLPTAIQQLAEQAKVEIGLWPPALAQQLQTKITLDADREPFWTVVRKLCDKTGLGLERSGQHNQITLVQRAEPWSKRPYSTQGVFMIVANSLQRNHSVDLAVPANVTTSFNMHLTALVDPKVKAMQGTTMVHLDEVTDDRGNSLVPQGFVPRSMTVPGWGSNWMWDLHAPLQYRPDMGKRITLFRGSVRFLVQEKVDVWEIDNILTTPNPERPIPIGKYAITGLRKTADRAYELAISIEHSANMVPNQSPLTDFTTIQRSIRLLDASGLPYRLSGGGGGGGGGRLQYTLNYQAQDQPNKPAGPPAKLIWEIPLELKEVTVPIELKDIPIP